MPNERLGRAPSWFNELQRDEWNRLSALPHIKRAHSTIVQHACVLYDRFVQDAKGERSMTASERQTFHSIYMQLGCTPASSAKISAPVQDKADDPWANL